jgi:hypothetical protein
MSEPNYNGCQPNNTSYVKTFIEGIEPNLWTTDTYSNTDVIQPSIQEYDNVYIPGILYVNKIIYTNTNPNTNTTLDIEEKNNEYLELIPILLNKIQEMQIEIDQLKNNFDIFKKNIIEGEHW